MEQNQIPQQRSSGNYRRRKAAPNKLDQGTNRGNNSTKRTREVSSSRSRRSKTKEKRIYDIFGAKIKKSYRQQRTIYQPTYCEVTLPQPPHDLICGLCGDNIAGNAEILEALEIQPGEFSAQSDTPNNIPAHFSCVLQALNQRVQLEQNETIAYLGAGKFAVVSGAKRTVKRLIERSEWSQNSSLAPTNWSSWRQDMTCHTLLGALSIETDL